MKTLTQLLIGAALVFAIAGCQKKTETAATPATTPPAAPAAKPAAPAAAPEGAPTPAADGTLQITGPALSKAYADDEDAASEKYNGKTFILTGSIKEVGETRIKLKGHDEASFITVDFDEGQESKISGLKVDASLKMRCKGDVPLDGARVEKCVIL